ncbi:MAG: HD domain-containing protein [Planctomycetes bacterium]|nr:HD domain-containing protein [Planctomycetota bacterium]
MKAELVIRGGKRDGEVIGLSPHGRITFGRSPSCDQQFVEENISRTHFALEGKGSFFLLTDLQSSAGTLVNGKKVASKILHPGDLITAGPISFDFKAPEAVSPKLSANSAMLVNDPAISSIKLEKNFEDGSFALGDNEVEDNSPANAPELLGRARKALQTIYQVGNLIHTEESLDRVCHTIMDVVMDVIKPDRGFLVMYHPEDKTLEPIVVRRRRLTSGSARTSTRMLRAVDDELQLCKPVVLYSIKKAMAVISGEVFPETGDANSKHIRSAMSVPVRTNTDVIGAVYVDNVDTEAPFAAHHLELLAAIGRQAGIAIQRARLFEDMEGLFYSCVRTLVSSIEAKDQYTHGHSERVTAFAVTIAEEMALDAETLDNVRLGGLLHDVGKIGVAEKILTKPSRLTPDEIKVIRQHPARGGEILSHIRNIPGVIAAVKHHHEMYNGLGYPDGLSGQEIPQTARIVALADAFDAMTSNRSYRRNFDVGEAVAEFTRCSGDQFDPEVCEVMIKLLKEGRIIPCNELFARGIDVTKSIY